MDTSLRAVVITGIKEEAPDVKTFTIAAAEAAPISYKAGQFMTFVFHHHGKEERRSFSISSSPDANEPLRFTVKRVENGAYSRLLIDRAKPGDKLFTTGAAGLFTLPADLSGCQQVFFFAAGIGITPILSLIKTLLLTTRMHVTLVYSNRTRQEVVFIDELEQLATRFGERFRIEMLYSTSFDLSRARLSKALLPILLDELAITGKDKMLFYVCGPFQYMRMVIITLEEVGIRGDMVKRENFNTNAVPMRKALPPDTATHKATIIINGTQHEVVVQYPDSILQAAKKAGLSLPYSCEVGRCGSCAALCTNGSVWLSYNEVLMDSDLKAGKILTCVGHPINGDVVIKL